MHNNLQITYKNNKPYGIRDENGYLVFFADVPKFPAQEERYHKEVQAQLDLADYLLSCLQTRDRNTACTGRDYYPESQRRHAR
jgi:hypothetical protein